jgi:ABC-type oligopeptide transport system substrate-binding subunit
VRVDLADNEGIWATNPDTYVGLGAFKMTKYAVDDVITFEKNPYYWNADAVKIDGLNFYLSEDNTAILTAYENNTVDYIQSISSSEFDRLNAAYPGELAFWPTQGTYYILFNVYKDMSPAGKQLSVQEQSKARFALGQLVNRYEIVTYVTKGGENPATGFFPDSLSDGLNPNVRAAEGYNTWYTGTNEFSDVNPDYTVDQVEALQTLMALGYPYEGTIEGGDIHFTDFPAIEFAFNNSGNNAAIIQYVQQTWNQFGIPSTINTEAWATLQTKLKAGDAEAARMGWVADFNDVVNFLEIFISNSGNNYPRLGRAIGDYTRNSEVTADAGMGAYWGENGDQTWAEAYDALVDEVKAATDPAERAELAAKAEKILMATGGVNPLYYYTTAQMLKPNVHGVVRLALGDVIWNYAYMD